MGGSASPAPAALRPLRSALVAVGRASSSAGRAAVTPRPPAPRRAARARRAVARDRQVEPVPRRQGVQDRAGHHERSIALPAIRVGLDVRPSTIVTAPSPDHLQRLVGVRRSRTCPRRARCRGATATARRAPAAGRCGRVARNAGRSRGPAGSRGRPTAAPSGSSASGPAGRTRPCARPSRSRRRDVPARTAPAIVRVRERVAQTRARDHLRQPGLVPAGEEHAGGASEQERRPRDRRPPPAPRAGGPRPADPEPDEQLPVELRRRARPATTRWR